MKLRKNDEEEFQALLASCSASYATMHAEQTRILSDGSFVSAVTLALLRCKLPPCLWLRDYGNELPDFINLANDKDLLARTILTNHTWVKVDSVTGESDEKLFSPS